MFIDNKMINFIIDKHLNKFLNKKLILNYKNFINRKDFLYFNYFYWLYKEEYKYPMEGYCMKFFFKKNIMSSFILYSNIKNIKINQIIFLNNPFIFFLKKKKMKFQKKDIFLYYKIKMQKNFYWLNYTLSLLNKFILNFTIYDKNYLKIKLKDLKYIPIVLNIFKLHNLLRYTQLSEIICVDNLKNNNRFNLNYIILSLKYNSRLVISVDLDSKNIVNSVISIFSSANWLEREIFDLFGVFFLNHNDLRRILTDYGFNGYPFRKDFPLNGYFEIRYDENKQYLVYESIELMQNMRFYDFINPFFKKYLF